MGANIIHFAVWYLVYEVFGEFLIAHGEHFLSWSFYLAVLFLHKWFLLPCLFHKVCQDIFTKLEGSFKLVVDICG